MHLLQIQCVFLGITIIAIIEARNLRFTKRFWAFTDRFPFDLRENEREQRESVLCGKSTDKNRNSYPNKGAQNLKGPKNQGMR